MPTVEPRLVLHAYHSGGAEMTDSMEMVQLHSFLPQDAVGAAAFQANDNPFGLYRHPQRLFQCHNNQGVQNLHTAAAAAALVTANVLLVVLQ
mmetsp:Transcript_46251/g.112095  ORF Transcript_46251/g.112095 Transcript_46251/m.112095 type:complete len:92 (+) Transcript_46251:57-332(+)